MSTVTMFINIPNEILLKELLGLLRRMLTEAAVSGRFSSLSLIFYQICLIRHMNDYNISKDHS